MSEIHYKPGSPKGAARVYLARLLKIIALVLIFFSIGYWARLVGITNSEIAFDSLPIYWKIAGASLVILQPVAALGLWNNTQWGVVVWIIVISIEVVMYGVYPALFGAGRGIILFHGISLFAYAVALALIYIRESRDAAKTDA